MVLCSCVLGAKKVSLQILAFVGSQIRLLVVCVAQGTAPISGGARAGPIEAHRGSFWPKNVLFEVGRPTRFDTRSDATP